MSFTPYKGASLLIETGPQPGKCHLFVVVTENHQLNEYILVCVCSQREGSFFDPTCEVVKGDHSFIQHPSFVDYRHTRVETAEHLRTLLGGWMAWQRHDVSKAVLDKMSDGVLESDFTKGHVERAYNRAP